MFKDKSMSVDLTVGQRVMIHADTLYGAVRATGTVIQVGDYSFRLECTKAIPANELQPGQMIKLSLLEKEASLPIATGFLRILRNQPNVIVLKLPSKDWRVNRREFFRADISLPVTILRPNGDRVNATTGNISGGGLLIVSNTAFTLGEEIEVTMDIEDLGILIVRARIVWISHDTRSEQDQCGVKFVDIDPRDRNKICRTVISKELQDRRNELKDLSEHNGNL